MKTMITGGAGFIGSNLSERLSDENEVIILDDLSTGKIENIEGVIEKKNVEFVKGSITDLDLLDDLTKEIDWVFHQGALPSVPRSVKNPKDTTRTNVMGTLNVLIAARDHGVEKVVYASSSSIYGGGETLPKKEDMKPRTLSPYAASKLSGENYCEAFREVYGLNTVALRYFNVFGPRQDPRSEYAAVVPKFITRLMNGRPPVIYGDGEQTRDFTYVDNVVQTNLLAARKDEVGTFNVGCGERVSINELARSLTEITGREVEPVHDDPREGDVKHSQADISKIRERLGYSPEVSLREGLEKTVRWYIENHG